MAGRVWTSVDFSGCTLSSGDQQVIVIVSLWIELSGELDTESLDQQVIIITRTYIYMFYNNTVYHS